MTTKSPAPAGPRSKGLVVALVGTVVLAGVAVIVLVIILLTRAPLPAAGADASPTATASNGQSTPQPSLSVSPELTPKPTQLASPVTRPTVAPVAGPLRLRPLPQHLEALVRGIRIRDAPTTDAKLIGTLPVHGTAFALLGPLLNDGYSWYLVQDDTGDEPTYERGWMAVGTDSDPWVTESLGWGGQYDYLASFDGVGPARRTAAFVAGFMALEWAALGDDCTFAGELVSESGDRVQIGGDAVHGLAQSTLDAYWFDDHPEMDGRVRILIDSRCSWAINVIRYQG